MGKSGNFNVGIEASFLDNRLNINAEYYNKKTTDMLLNYPMATSTGFSGYNANVGDMRNSGLNLKSRVLLSRPTTLLGISLGWVLL